MAVESILERAARLRTCVEALDARAAHLIARHDALSARAKAVPEPIVSLSRAKTAGTHLLDTLEGTLDHLTALVDTWGDTLGTVEAELRAAEAKRMVALDAVRQRLADALAAEMGLDLSDPTVDALIARVLARATALPPAAPPVPDEDEAEPAPEASLPATDPPEVVAPDLDDLVPDESLGLNDPAVLDALRGAPPPPRAETGAILLPDSSQNEGSSTGEDRADSLGGDGDDDFFAAPQRSPAPALLGAPTTFASPFDADPGEDEDVLVDASVPAGELRPRGESLLPSPAAHLVASPVMEPELSPSLVATLAEMMPAPATEGADPGFDLADSQVPRFEDSLDALDDEPVSVADLDWAEVAPGDAVPVAGPPTEIERPAVDWAPEPLSEAEAPSVAAEPDLGDGVAAAGEPIEPAASDEPEPELDALEPQLQPADPLEVDDSEPEFLLASAPEVDDPEPELELEDTPEVDDPEPEFALVDAPEVDDPEPEFERVDEPENRAPEPEFELADAPGVDDPEPEFERADEPEIPAPEPELELADEPEGAEPEPAIELADEPEVDDPEPELELADEPEGAEPEPATELADEPEVDDPEPELADEPDDSEPAFELADEPEAPTPEPEFELADAPEIPAPEFEPANAPEASAPEPEFERATEPESAGPEPEFEVADEPEVEGAQLADEPEAPAPELEVDAPEPEFQLADGPNRAELELEPEFDLAEAPTADEPAPPPEPEIDAPEVSPANEPEVGAPEAELELAAQPKLEPAEPVVEVTEPAPEFELTVDPVLDQPTPQRAEPEAEFEGVAAPETDEVTALDEPARVAEPADKPLPEPDCEPEFEVVDAPEAPPALLGDASPTLIDLEPGRRRLESLEARLAELEAQAQSSAPAEPRPPAELTPAPAEAPTVDATSASGLDADIDWAQLAEADDALDTSWVPLAGEDIAVPPHAEAVDLLAGLDDELDDAWSTLDIPDLRSGGRPAPAPRVPRPASRAPSTVTARRAHPVERSKRRGLSVKVGLEHGNYFFTGFSSNISETGLFVTTHQLLDVSSRVEVFFDLPDGHAINCLAEVRWVRPFNPNDPDSQPGMGLVFAKLGGDDRIKVERYIAHEDAPIFD